MSSGIPEAHVTWASSFSEGPWDVVVAPPGVFLSARQDSALGRADWIVYGPLRWLKPVWLAGALEYLKEPWTADELALRLRGPEPAVLRWTDHDTPLSLDNGRLRAGSGAEVRLSGVEAGLLRLLVLRRGLPVSRAVLGWAAGCGPGRVVDTLVGRLRRKLAAVLGRPARLEAVRGVGYRVP